MKQTFRYFISFYRPYRTVFFLDLLCASLISLIDIAYPLLFNFCVQDIFVSTRKIQEVLPWIALILLGAYILRSLCRYYVTCQGHIMGAAMETDMRQDLFDKFQKLSFSYYDDHNTGTMMSRLISDLFDIAELAHHGPENIFISLIKILGSFIVMGILNWKLMLGLSGVTVFLLIFSWFENKKMRSTFADNRRKIALVNASVQDSLAGIRVVQSFANEDVEDRKFREANQAYYHSKENNYKAMGSYYSGTLFFQGLLYLVVIVLGGWLISKGELAVSELAAFALYVNVFVSPLQILIEFTEMFQKGYSGFERFEEIMKVIPEIKNPEHPVVLPDMKGSVEFDRVSFKYASASENVLDQISFSIPAGQNVALVGPSGGGKTTICSLIPRFYDVSEGSVRIDGQDVRTLDLESLRSQIGVVQQDVYLFDGTIADNIRYGKPDAGRDEILEAARRANLQDFLSELPDGIDTWVGERGARLSGGQKQRISIARIFLKNPKIVLLDEATSALDNESEAVIQQALNELAQNRTCLTIAHRLSTIRKADKILVINEEGIAEAGSHEELMKKNGIYRRYYDLQFEGMDNTGHGSGISPLGKIQ